MIAAPVFFPRDEWVAPPSNWAPSGIQVGKGYNLSAGEGSRVLRERMERATGGLHYWNIPDPQIVVDNFARYGAAVEVHPRLGKDLFSLAVRDAYHGACAITGEHSLPPLEAARIMPYSRGGEHRVDNGLLLRSDLHRLYNRGYVTVTPDYVFRSATACGMSSRTGTATTGWMNRRSHGQSGSCGGPRGSGWSGIPSICSKVRMMNKRLSRSRCNRTTSRRSASTRMGMVDQ
jgi:hypothetical protein